MTTLLSNRYQIIQSLGSGGFGETFLVEDTQMPSRPRRVLKRLKPVTDNPQVYEIVQERFQREAAILEKVGSAHPQIPNLFAYFAEGGELYLVQEWVDGQTLTQMVKTQGSLGENQVQQMLVDLLPVLQFIHTEGIIHRDIKSDNILIQQQDQKPFLIDFGAVKETLGIQLDSRGNTTSSILIGTQGFMPPEQAAGRPVFSSDLYSLGLTMIYLLTGKWPQELINQWSGEVQWRSHAPNISPAFAAVLDKAIQYHPRDRYTKAEEMLMALQGSTVPPTEYGSWNQKATVPPTEPGPWNQPADVQSNSGQATGSKLSDQFVPEEIRGWNWGAFLLSGLWCIPNQVWIGLLSWVPPASLVMPFVLGAKGNEMAWKNRRWTSVDAFKAHQRGWTIAGLVTSGFGFFAFFMLGLIGSLPDLEGDTFFDDPPSPTPVVPVRSAEADALFEQAFAKQEAGNFQGAIEDYTRAIQLNPNDAIAYNNRGNAYLDLNSPQTAIADYNRAIQIDPNYASPYYNRGLAHAELGNTEVAIDDFDIAADLYLQQGSEEDYFDAIERINELGGFN